MLYAKSVSLARFRMVFGGLATKRNIVGGLLVVEGSFLWMCCVIDQLAKHLGNVTGRN